MSKVAWVQSKTRNMHKTFGLKEIAAALQIVVLDKACS